MKNQCIEKDLSLMGLLQDNEQRKGFSIEIPALQRDYAQGRWAQKEIGKGFVNALIKALDGGDKAKGLHLDFIYGYTDEKDSKKLILIDGQQRLTTLWLLHLYLYKRLELEGQVKESNDIKNWLGRFSYAARSGAKEFCQALLEQNFLDSEAKKPSDLIYDKSPLFGGMRLLRHDPTVAAMLNMLDWIHEKVEGLDAKNEQEPKPKDSKKLVENLNKITFDFFDMEQFGLGEELYIKMNARGKPLSEYENLKALIEKKLKEESKNEEDQEDVARLLERIDAEWSDYFYSDDSNSDLKERARLFDARGKNFLHFAAWFFNLAKVFGTDGVQGKTEEDKQKLLDGIKDKQSSMEFYEVLQEKNLKQLDRVMRLLKSLQKVGLLGDLLEYERLGFLSQPSFFDGLTYKGQCYFFGLIAYCKKEDSLVQIREESKIEDLNVLLRYLRILRNLVENHPESFDDYMPKFFYLIQEVSGQAHDISGLENRVRELELYSNIFALEVRKAGLIQSDGGERWEKILGQLDRHPLLRGRVDFLFDFSHEECDDNRPHMGEQEYSRPKIEVFVRYATIAMGLLDKDFLSEHLTLLQRAWLSMGDYAIWRTNWWYGDKWIKNFDDRNAWNSLLKQHDSEDKVKRSCFKKLLDNLIKNRVACGINELRSGLEKSINPKGKYWADELLIKQKEMFDYLALAGGKTCRIYYDNSSHPPKRARLLHGKRSNTKESRDLLFYGFYHYCKEKGLELLLSDGNLGGEKFEIKKGCKSYGWALISYKDAHPRIVIGDRKPYALKLEEQSVFEEFEAALKAAELI